MNVAAKLGMASVALSLLAAGCGYSEEEWQAQLDKYNRLVAQNNDGKRKLDETLKLLQAERDKVAQLEKSLEAAGVDLKKLGADLDTRNSEIGKLSASQKELEKALKLYKERADQLERIKARFEQLRAKLNELVSLGLSVRIRNNRMMISLPGDVLFDTGKDSLKKEGEDILMKVANIINGDASLRSRFYQVAGHTDNEALKGGVFRDNWGLSLMRGRSVLLFLIDPKHGALPDKRWSAAGFADTDPLDPAADNDSKEARQRNRRCELVVVPSAEEMLDLKAIAQ
jgi:chemotaxis protein MotB